MPAERNLGYDFQRSCIDEVERALRFVADINAASVRSCCGAVIYFDAGYPSDDLVRGGVDDVDVIAGTVGLDDSNFPRRRRFHAASVAAHPGCERLPFRIILRLPMFAAVMTRIASGFLCERVGEQLALQR